MIKQAMLAGVVGLRVETLSNSGRQTKYGIRLENASAFLFKGSSKKADVFIRGFACAIREAAKRMDERELVQTLTKLLGDFNEQQSKA